MKYYLDGALYVLEMVDKTFREEIDNDGKYFQW